MREDPSPAQPSQRFELQRLERLRTLGQPTDVLQDSGQEAHWVAIEIDQKTRRMRAAATKDVPALIEGY